jgi:hypothetical protein
MQQDAFRNKIILNVQRKLTDHPSAVASMFGGLTGESGKTYDDLMRIKETLFFSAATPARDISEAEATRLGLSAADAAQIRRGGMGTEAIQKMWDKTILRPLRYRFVNNVSTDGILDPGKFLSQIERIESTTPELLAELFGGSAQIEYMKKLGTTLSLIGQNSERNIFIQLKQAGAISTLGRMTLGAGAGAGVAAYSDDDPAMGAAGGAALVLLAPAALAQLLTKPTLVRMLTDGLEAGAKTKKLAVALRKIGGMAFASNTYDDVSSQNASNYYGNLDTNEQ